MIIAIPDDYHGLVPQLDCFRTLVGHDVHVFRDVAPSFEKQVANLREAEIVVAVRERTDFTRDLLAQLPKLKLIAQTGRSAKSIDLAACTELGIAVCAGSHASPYTVAEHTWALILASVRRIAEDAALMKQGKWRDWFSMSLRGKTLGVYGLGKIGEPVAATGTSFGMRVQAFARDATAARARELGFEAAKSKEEFFEQSDVLSIHLRMSDATRHIITRADLARMKPTALIVNTARAELIAPGALVEALKKGCPGFAATDVYENEPVQNGDHPLLKLPNAICTPHTAWLEPDTYGAYFGEAFEQAVAFAAGKPVKLLNPDVMQKNNFIPGFTATRKRSVNMNIAHQRLTHAMATLCLAATAGTVLAQQDFPTKPIRMIVGVAPGGATDILARAVGAKLSDTFKQQVIVENRPGANHIIGGEITAKSPRDGYTIQMVPEGFVINASVYEKLPFDPLKDFSPIAIVANVPNVLVVHPSLPARTVKQFAALARARPGQLSYGSSSVGSPSHMSGELFKAMTKVDYVHVPYKGQSLALVDLMGGHIQFLFPSIPSSVAHIRSGKLIPLGVTTKQRAGALPDVPTIDEAGITGYEVSGWYGVIGPAGIPQPIVARLNKAINDYLQAPESRKQLSNEGADPRTGTPEEFGAAMARDLQKWAKVVASAGIKIK